MQGSALLVHGSALALGDDAVLLRGRSGAGKSDLALRLLSTHLPVPGAGIGMLGRLCLIADDQVRLSREGRTVRMAPPPMLAGKLEVRGLGILNVPHVDGGRLRLIVDLVGQNEVERLPDPHSEAVLGVLVERVRLWPFEPSAALKVLLALERALADAAAE